MKKTALVLLIVFATLISCACGGGDSSGTLSDLLNSIDAGISTPENSVGNGTVTDSTSMPDSSVIESSEPEVEPEYFEICGWQDGLFFGYTEVEDETRYGAMDSKGNIAFLLDVDKRFAASLDDEEESKVFFGDYALLKDNTVINRKGEKVFDLAATDFDAIYYHECMDVGYILCSKEINTFEETGTHYFAVKLADGSSFKFEEEMKPMSVHHTYYFGNGIFLHSPANSGFGTKHTFYNLLTKEIYQGYKLDENGEKVYEYLPDLYFFGGFKGDTTTKPTTNGRFYAKSGETIVDYELATGHCNIIEIKDILGVDRVSSDKDTKTPYITKMKYSGESYNSEKFMLNVLTSKYILMNDYADYEIYSYKAGTGYLAMVTNDGGGKFVTVIKEDGTRAFDPIASSLIQLYNENLFLLRDEDGNMELYNWKGELLKEWTSKLNKTIMGDNSMFVVTMVDSTLSGFVFNKDGKEVNITALPETADINTTQCMGYGDGYYVFENLIVSEAGAVVTTQTND